MENIPRLYFIAKRDIGIGEELCWDYGDRRRDSLKKFPWLASAGPKTGKILKFLGKFPSVVKILDM